MAGPETFTDEELDRYARHIIMREIGGPGQKRLRGARVLVVGAGGLGSPAIMYLAAAGVGTIGIVDDDEVALSNLQRQIAHTSARVGARKTDSAAETARTLNPHIVVKTHNERITPENVQTIIKPYRLVIDGTDNFETRYLLNRACAPRGTTLVSAAITQWEGQLSVYKPKERGPCYECIFPEAPAPHLQRTCAEAGVLGPLAGVMGSMIAAETIKDIARAGNTMNGRMIIYDALEGQTRTLELEKRAECPVCAALT
ncbi:MAG: HesA/MoeB/ThiF family protein [Pseudomonadota bacterium]